MRTLNALLITSIAAIIIAAGDGVAGAGSSVSSQGAKLDGVMRWRCIGPNRGGRITAVAGALKRPGVYYQGATGGGVWRTRDNGITWEPISDGYFKRGSVGAIAVSDPDPDIVYVGMGEACIRNNFSHGDGVYKSIDGGNSWTHMGLSDTQQIGRIRIHPQDPNLVYVAALGHVFGPSEERGVFRSKDGGKSWQRVLFKDAYTGAVDLAMDPSDPRRLYAALWQVARTPYGITDGGPGSGIYRSNDGGDTWTELTTGLPSGLKGKIGIAVSPARPSRLWAIIAAIDGGVFRSDDGGTSWKRVNADPKLYEAAFYFTHIYAHPRNPDVAWVLNQYMYRSDDGGSTFEVARRAYDYHDMWILPSDPQVMIIGHDNGAQVSINGGAAWSPLDNQSTVQFYTVNTDSSFPYRVAGAAQDYSTFSVGSQTPNWKAAEWYTVGGGESGQVIADRGDSDVVYAGGYGGLVTKYNHRTKQVRNISPWPDSPMGRSASGLKYRFPWTVPILSFARDPKELFVGANVVFKSRDQGQTWNVVTSDLTRNEKSKQGPSGGPIYSYNVGDEYYSTISVIAESPLTGALWVGSDDGLLHVSDDRGGNWRDVTPKRLLQESFISSVEPSSHDPKVVYLGVNRYKSDDFRPYIYRTRDAGTTWELITAGLPEDDFVRVVREDQRRPGLLYAGTERGAYVSLDAGIRWHSLQLNLPAVPIMGMTVKQDDLVIATQGRSFWVLDDLSPLQKLAEDADLTPFTLVKPRNSYRSGAMEVRQPVGNVNQVGIYYFLQNSQAGDATLEILDSSGRVIRSFSSRKGGETTAQPKSDPEQVLPAKDGWNVFFWDMRHRAVIREPMAYLWGAALPGPRSTPGQYQVRLTVGNVSKAQTFDILKDPRIETSASDFKEQFELLVRIGEAVRKAKEGLDNIKQARTRLKAIAERAESLSLPGGITAEIHSIEESLSTIESTLHQKDVPFPPMAPNGLQDKLLDLTRIVGAGDERPTQQSYEVFQLLSSQMRAELTKLTKLCEQEIPRLERRSE